MKLEANRASLLKAWSHAAAVVPSRTPKPVLQNILVEAANGTLQLTAQGSESALRIEVQEAEVQEDGQVLLPAAKVSALLNANTDERITLSVENGKAHLRSTHSKVALPTEDPANFPPYDEAPEQQPVEVYGDALAAMLKRTTMASGVDGENYVLSGVCLDVLGDDLATVSADGRRMSVARGKITSAPLEQPFNVLLPTGATKILLRLLGDETVRIIGTNRAAYFAGDGWECRLRLLEGRFPNWRAFLQERDAVQVEVPVNALSAALRQVAIATTPDKTGIDFGLHGGELRLACETPVNGAVEVCIPVPPVSRDVQLEINHQFVSDYLRVLDQGLPVTVDLVDKDSALRLAQGTGEYIAMPMGD